MLVDVRLFRCVIASHHGNNIKVACGEKGKGGGISGGWMCFLYDSNLLITMRGRIITHGAKVTYEQCSFKGCNGVIKGRVCVTHGATKEHKKCGHEGFTNQARKGV